MLKMIFQIYDILNNDFLKTRNRLFTVAPTHKKPLLKNYHPVSKDSKICEWLSYNSILFFSLKQLYFF